MSIQLEDPQFAPKSSLDVRRAARGFVLVVWTGFFAYLWFTGEVSRYLGPRTYWVVPFGGITLALASLMHLLTLRSPAPTKRVTVGETIGLAAMLMPLLAVVLVPAPTLGALAASKKNAASGGIAAVTSVLPPDPDPTREVSFIDIHFANESQQYAAAVGLRDGYPIELTGFVTRPSETPEGSFYLTRFYVSCCAADAIPYSVRVTSEDESLDHPEDTWLDITGELIQEGDEWVLVAGSIRTGVPPQDPYLY